MFTARQFKLALLVVSILILSPVLVLAQDNLNPDDITKFAKFVIDAVRGGDWAFAVLASLVVVVSGVRKLAGSFKPIKDFVSSDVGGVILNVGTLVPLTLIGAKLAGQPLSLGLVLAAVGGPTALYVMGRKLLRAVVANTAIAKFLGSTRIGSVVLKLLTFASGAGVKKEVEEKTTKVFDSKTPAAAASVASELDKPPST